VTFEPDKHPRPLPPAPVEEKTFTPERTRETVLPELVTAEVVLMNAFAATSTRVAFEISTE
jgi:hypothetical protein